MATRTIVTSDYTGEDLGRDEEALKVKLTIKVGNDAAKSFDLDFSQDDLDDFIESLNNGRIIPASRPTSTAPSKSGTRTRAKSDAQAWLDGTKFERDDVAAWGRENGFEVAERGRLKTDLIAAFRKEQES